MADDLTAYNWPSIRSVYERYVKLNGVKLEKVNLPERHFRALELAARRKRFGRRSRADHNLIKAIGNWLYSEEYGAWRNPNRTKPYKPNNKELWADFVAGISDRR